MGKIQRKILYRISGISMFVINISRVADLNVQVYGILTLQNFDGCRFYTVRSYGWNLWMEKGGEPSIRDTDITRKFHFRCTLTSPLKSWLVSKLFGFRFSLFNLNIKKRH